MYEDYYRFRRQPFSPTPDPEFLYKSDMHGRALEELLRGIRRREGVLLLTGDVGTGKTTTTRAVRALLDRDMFTALVINPFVSADELLRVLLQDFGVVSDSRITKDVSRQSLVETLNRFLLSLSFVGASALVVVDEAQNLQPSVLEQLRILTGLETDRQKLLQILLVGQPELQTMLETPEMRPLNERIARRCSLGSLNRDEVEQYVSFRIGVAGGGRETIFSADALDLVYKLSEGIPRRINQLCDRSLEVGFAALSPTVDETLVARAAQALQLTVGPAVPFTVPDEPAAERWQTNEPAVPAAVGPPSSPTAEAGRRPRRSSKVKRRLVAAGVAVAVAAGVGIWVGVTRVVPSSPRDGSEVRGAPTAPAVAVPPPVDVESSGVAVDQTYRVRAGEFETRPLAEAVAEILRRLGGDVSVARSDGDTDLYLIWVGPYATLADAQSMETALTDSGLEGIEIVASGRRNAPAP